MRTIKSVGVLSVGKVLGLLYAAMGVIVVPFFLLFSALGALSGEAAAAGFGLAMAIAMTIFLPIFYGVAGFIGGVIMAFIYNLIAGRLGGIEIELTPAPQPQLPAPFSPPAIPSTS
jgi:hypothetical protein